MRQATEAGRALAGAVLVLMAGAAGAQPAGTTFRDCPGCPEMVVVPSGRFQMGSPSSDKGRLDDEGPVHEVTIARPFAVGVNEVTRGEFARFAEATGRSTGNNCWSYESGEWKARSGRHWRDPGFSQTDEHPVVCVRWNDAQAYVRWLSGETGEAYRLPSEAEWEYVARAGTRTAWYWGESESGQCRYANGADEASGDLGGGGHDVMTAMRGRRRWGATRRTDTGCTMCWGTYGSGCRIAGTRAMREHRVTGVRGRRGSVAGGCCVAAPGTPIPGTSAPPTAAGTGPATGSTSSGSGLPGRSRLESLRPCLRGPGGEAPWSARSGLLAAPVGEAGPQRRIARLARCTATGAPSCGERSPDPAGVSGPARPRVLCLPGAWPTDPESPGPGA